MPTDTIVKCCIGVGCSFIICYFVRGKTHTYSSKHYKINVKIATGESGETSGEMFHNIEVECDDAVQGKLALQLHISQPSNHPFPVRVITERSLMALVK